MFCASNVTAQNDEPKNNLRITLSQLKLRFPNLTYCKTDERGDLYSDGQPKDDAAVIYFHIKRNKVTEEAMIIQTNDGFPKDWYDKTVNAFLMKGGYIFSDVNENDVKLTYSYFDIYLIYKSERGDNTALLVYTLRQ